MDHYSTVTDTFVHKLVLLQYNGSMTENNRKTIGTSNQIIHTTK